MGLSVKNAKWFANIALLLSFISSDFVGASEIPPFLQRFSLDPYSTSMELPEKTGGPRRPLFDDATIRQRNFVTIKDHFRQKSLCKASQPGEACKSQETFLNILSGSNDKSGLGVFLGRNYESNIYNLKSYQEGQVATLPWAGYYWPYYEGGIGHRYADPRFPRSQTFKINLEYYKKNYLQNPSTDEKELANLSPAEKYDYLASDSNWSLTQAIWNESESYMDANGNVERWMGICHGWAPASIMIPEPRKTVEIDLDSGRGNMKVYPHDLKGLISQLWAEASVDYNFLGGRCNEKNPRTDSAGRIVSADCFDVNPATWHLVLPHMLGVLKESFVLDVTYDYEVWNQPIYSYKLKYFNPNTKVLGELDSSMIKYSDVTNDPYKSYRSPEARYLVGVISEIKYSVEAYPSHTNRVDESVSRLVTVSYYYDLELDKDFNIIGGEWYQKAHPDFLWKPFKGARAFFRGEDRLSRWEGSLPLPFDYLNMIKSASPQRFPLARILEKLIEQSK